MFHVRSLLWVYLYRAHAFVLKFFFFFFLYILYSGRILCMLKMLSSLIYISLIILWPTIQSSDYSCPTNSDCMISRRCTYRESSSLKWCDDRKTRVCCPKRYQIDNIIEQRYDRNEDRYYENGLDYYDDGYNGPLSSEAKRILRNYDEKECGVRKSFYGRVSTGHEVDLGTSKFGEFPWQVAILLRVNSDSRYGHTMKFLCGGTVINPVLVLTAAHCVKGVRLRSIKIKLGEWNLKGSHGEVFPTIDREISRVIVHDYYNSATFAHDIALLVLTKAVNLRKTPHVAPICLPPKHWKFSDHSKCFIAGWGYDVYKPNYGSNIMKFVSVSLLKDDCRHKLKESIPSLSNNFFKDDLRCISGSFGKDACVGDGGGAVVCPLSNDEAEVCRDGYNCENEHYFLAGIISWGSDECGQDNSVTVVTDFLSHRDWVAEKTRPYGGIDDYHGYSHQSYSQGYGSNHDRYDVYDHEYHGDRHRYDHIDSSYGNYDDDYDHSKRYDAEYNYEYGRNDRNYNSGYEHDYSYKRNGYKPVEDARYSRNQYNKKKHGDY